MSTWFDWAMGNSKFESLPQHIKDTAQWQRYQTDINTRETQVTVAKRRLAETKQAAEEWAAEQLEEEAERAAENAQHEQLLAEGARNLEDERRRGGAAANDAQESDDINVGKKRAVGGGGVRCFHIFSSPN